LIEIDVIFPTSQTLVRSFILAQKKKICNKRGVLAPQRPYYRIDPKIFPGIKGDY